MSRAVKKYHNNKQILKKHVSAIHAVADLTALQRKLVNALLYNAYDQLLTERNHKISTRILCEMIGFDSKNISYLKEALVGIMETVMEFDIMEDDGEHSWEAMSLLTYVRVKGGICTYRYEQSLAEKLYHPDVYSKINLSVLRNLRSSHALVLYENCLRYLTVGQTPVWELEVFRKLMAVQGRYKEFKFLKRDVITPAMREVNKHSNIQVDLRTVRKGRAVAALQFTVSPNPQLAMLGMDEDDEISTSKAYKSLLERGISKTLARSWVLEYGEDYVLDKIDLTDTKAAQGRIKSSKAGFLKAAVIEDFHNEAAGKKKAELALRSAREQRQAIEMRAESLRAALREVERDFRGVCAKVIENAYGELSEDEKKFVSEEFRRGLSSRIYVDAFRQGGWTDRRIYPDARMFWEKRGAVFPAVTEWAKKHGRQTPKALKEQIEKLDEQLKQPIKPV